MNSDIVTIRILLFLSLITLGIGLRLLASKLEQVPRLPNGHSLNVHFFIAAIVFAIMGAVPIVLTGLSHPLPIIAFLELTIAAGLLVWGSFTIGGLEGSHEMSRLYRHANRLRWTSLFMFLAALFMLPLFFALLMLIPFVIALMHTRRARTRMDQGAILWTIALSLKSERNLVSELETLQPTLSHRFQKRLQRLLPRLSSGQPLASSLSQTRWCIPSDALLILQTGEANGTLTESAKTAAIRHNENRNPLSISQYSPTMISIYLMVFPTVAALLTFGICYWIIPKFKEIFEGFDTELPAHTVRVIEAADLVLMSGLTPLLILLFVCFNLIFAIGYLIGFREFDVPIFGRMFRRLDLPNLLRILASTVESDRPVTTSVNVLSLAHRRSAVKRSLANVESLCHQGVGMWEAFGKTGLMTGDEVALLNSSEKAGNLPWTLRQLADSIERRLRFRWLVSLEFLQPGMVLIVGIITLSLCVGLFMPLVKLVNDLS